MSGDQAGDDVALRLQVVPDGGVAPDESTVASVEARLDGGPPRTPAAYPDDDTRRGWTALLRDVDAGVWDIVWSVRGTGAGVTRYRLTVGPARAGEGVRVYASTAELAAWLDDAPPETAGRLLRRASRVVDGLVRTAVYDVDDRDMPTDPRVRAALRDATCALVEWWDETGDEGTGAASALAGAQIGSVRLPGGASSSSGSSTPPGVAPAAWSALVAAGLTSQGPILPGRPVDVIRQGGHS